MGKHSLGSGLLVAVTLVHYWGGRGAMYMYNMFPTSIPHIFKWNISLSEIPEYAHCPLLLHPY